MSSKNERIKEREELIRRQEGGSHGRDPENLDPEMFEGEEAEIIRANKAAKRKIGDSGGSENKQALRPDERLPPD